jgi:hypothetical protein
MRRFIESLIDPGTFAQRYGARGFAGLVAFCAATEALWRAL